jgi:assimilatory nitrate reductase catalytic subunit
MATRPDDASDIIKQFGPHLAYADGARLQTGIDPDRVVPTHCCFCGQQCGINLKVKDNEVIGFEPREDFPFNRGMLCPKGVKRYLQGSHPDRLLSAYERDASGAASAPSLTTGRLPASLPRLSAFNPPMARTPSRS